MLIYRCIGRCVALGALTLLATAAQAAQAAQAAPATAPPASAPPASAPPASAPPAYTPITPSMADRTITLTGHDLTIEQIVAVARYGAKVALAPEARQREQENYGLLLEAAAEGVPVYWLWSRQKRAPG